MLRRDLDLQISVFEGASSSISALMLYARLRDAREGPSTGPSEYSILCREASSSPPFWISRSEVTDQDLVRLVTLLDAAGLPRRVPRVVANDSLLGASPYLAFAARIRGRTASLNLPLQNAGFSGEDAEPLRAAFRLLAELAPAGRRPAVREVVDRLVIDRAPSARGAPAMAAPPGASSAGDGPPRTRSPARRSGPSDGMVSGVPCPHSSEGRSPTGERLRSRIALQGV
jgi:hypothetical protein